MCQKNNNMKKKHIFPNRNLVSLLTRTLNILILFCIVPALFISCGDTIIDTINGKYLSNAPSLVFSAVEAKSSTMVEVTFKQDIIPASISGPDNCF